MATLSTGLTGRGGVLINLQYKKQIDLSEILDSLNINCGINWSWGTGANQVDLVWHDKLPAVGTTPGIITDLTVGNTIKDSFGDFADFSAVKLVFIENLSTTQTLHVFGHATDLAIVKTATDTIQIPPLGFFLWCDPSETGLLTVGASNLQICTVAGTADVNVCVLGLSA